jgi:hypothetical protein
MKGRRILLALALIGPGIARAQGGGLPVPSACQPTTRSALAALNSPFALVWAGGECADLSSFIKPTGQPMQWSMNGSMTIGGARLTFRALYDGDPFITFGATTTNAIAGPVTYAFLFGTPITPGFYNTATSTGGLSVTAGAAGSATVSTGLYPTYISGYGTNGLTPTNLGVDLGTTPCSAIGTPGGTTTTCNYGTTSNTFAPTFYDNLEALLTYTQTDARSVASWSGGVTLNATPVPEPATFALLALGFACTGLFAVRRGADRRS